MKPLLLKISIILCTLFLWAAMGSADTIKVGYAPGNDNENHALDLINELVYDYNANQVNSADLLPTTLSYLDKWDVGTAPLDGFTINIDNADRDNSGDWSFNVDNDWNKGYPNYFSLKAGNGFELWYTTQFDEVAWDTSGLGNKELSHISFWTAEENNTNPVPEPGTLALVGLGLAGIAGYRRKRRSS
jgi:hypothetical protein